jgi:hypothetical protein
MTPNQFTDIYKKLSDAKLITILENKKDYQALAIETALHELASRKLTEQQLAQAKQEIQTKEKQKLVVAEKKNEQIDLVKKKADSFFALFDPLIG